MTFEKILLSLPRTVSTSASCPVGASACRRRRIWTSTVRSSMMVNGAGSAPARSRIARSLAACTLKLPEIWPEPPRIGSRITGAEITEAHWDAFYRFYRSMEAYKATFKGKIIGRELTTWPTQVDFQAELGLVRRLRKEFEEAAAAARMPVREAAE